MCGRECPRSTCPFAFTELSEQAQSYGCLPTPKEILDMRTIHGKTWACHDDPSKPCQGALETLKERGLEYKVIDKELVTEESGWGEYV